MAAQRRQWCVWGVGQARAAMVRHGRPIRWTPDAFDDVGDYDAGWCVVVWATADEIDAATSGDEAVRGRSLLAERHTTSGNGRPLKIPVEATVRDVLDLLRQELAGDPLAAAGIDDGLSVFPRDIADRQFRTCYPQMRWVAAYAVRGANEGWYVHVDAVCNSAQITEQGHVARSIYIGKGFAGMPAAAHAAARISELLEAWDW